VTDTLTWTSRSGHRIVATRVEGKAAPKWREADHPRDRVGRFIETGAEVRIWGGAVAKVVANVGGGRMEVEHPNGAHQVIHRNYLTVVERPNGEAPTNDASVVAAAPERETGVPLDPSAAPVDDPPSPQNADQVTALSRQVEQALNAAPGTDPAVVTELAERTDAYVAALNNDIPDDEADERAAVLETLDRAAATGQDDPTVTGPLEQFREAVTAEPETDAPSADVTVRPVPTTGGDPVTVQNGDQITFTADGEQRSGQVVGFSDRGGPVVRTDDGEEVPLVPDAARWQHTRATDEPSTEPPPAPLAQPAPPPAAAAAPEPAPAAAGPTQVDAAAVQDGDVLIVPSALGGGPRRYRVDRTYPPQGNGVVNVDVTNLDTDRPAELSLEATRQHTVERSAAAADAPAAPTAADPAPAVDTAAAPAAPSGAGEPTQVAAADVAEGDVLAVPSVLGGGTRRYRVDQVHPAQSDGTVNVDVTNLDTDRPAELSLNPNQQHTVERAAGAPDAPPPAPDDAPAGGGGGAPDAAAAPAAADPDAAPSRFDIVGDPIPDHIIGDLMGGSAEAHLVRDANGAYHFTPARQALHRRIMEDLLDGYEPQENPRYNIMGGGPAAGKSTMEKAVPELSADAAVLNADDIKAQLPEYAERTQAGDPTAAAFSHEESSYLTKAIQREAFNRKINVTLDGTGNSNVASMQKKIDAARAAGYSVNGYYVTTPSDEAVARAQARGEKTGRFVPEAVIRGIHKSVSQVFPELAEQMDSAILYDTSTRDPVVVGRKESGGSWTVSDESKWRAFLDKAEEPADTSAGDAPSVAANADFGAETEADRARGARKDDPTGLFDEWANRDDAGEGYLAWRPNPEDEPKLANALRSTDAEVVKHADREGWTDEQLFAWANSKQGRHYANAVFDAGGGSLAQRRRDARGYLTLAGLDNTTAQ
jgi:predicted ABC-type ATPase